MNDADDRNQTILMQAVLSDRPEVVQLLLNKGADTEVKNIYGHSAYDMAKHSTNKASQRTYRLFVRTILHGCASIFFLLIFHFQEMQKILNLLGSEPEPADTVTTSKRKVTWMKPISPLMIGSATF